MNETEIVIQMQQGKEEAFDLLFDMYKLSLIHTY